jgi:hypothetical protein
MPDPLPAPPPATPVTPVAPAPARPTPIPPPAPRTYDPVAAFLSFLLPGLGQVLQGRIGKGVMFFACLYTLFFYGLWMGAMRNVWLPEPAALPPAAAPFVGELSDTPKALYHRPQFLLQVGIGVAAWPAIAQYVAADPEAAPDAPPPIRLLGDTMRAPTEAQLNDLQRGRDTSFDLGWVFTVIAGALNLLVIYDAFAGPVVRSDEEYPPRPAPKAPKKGGAA